MSRQGLGWPYAPGIWTEEQSEAWKPVVEAVHEAGGRIFCQLWHMGRVVHPSFLGGEPPVSASATTAPYKAHTYEGRQPYAEARPLRLDEIPGLLDDYARAAAYAIAAGFDGVQLHAANGYLIDQFLRDSTNFRDDDYGGPVDNRIRLLLEATRAIADMVGPERTAVRLSPNSETQGCEDSDPRGPVHRRRRRAGRDRNRLPRASRAGAGGHVRQVRRPARLARDPQGVPGAAGPQLRFRPRACARRRWRRNGPTRSASAGRSSPIPTCRRGCSTGPRSRRT